MGVGGAVALMQAASNNMGRNNRVEFIKIRKFE